MPGKRRAAAERGGPMPRELLDAAVEPDVVRVPSRKAVCIDGAGTPGDAAFSRCVGALFGVAYTLKFARKAAGRADCKIGPLEGRWTAAPGTPRSARPPPRSAWRWRLRLAVPRDVTAREVHAAIHLAVERRGGKLEGSREAAAVSLERIAASRYGRVLHVGPYADEPASIARIREALADAKLAPDHGHLEVYLSDPHRTPPARLRTVLLVPVRSAGAAHRAGGSPASANSRATARNSASAARKAATTSGSN